MKVLILTCVILSSGHIWSSFGLEVLEETSKQLPNPSTTSVIENSETAAINSEKIPKAAAVFYSVLTCHMVPTLV